MLKRQYLEMLDFQQDEIKIGSQHTHAFVYSEQNFFTQGKSFQAKFSAIVKRIINEKTSPVSMVEKYLEKRKLYFSR